MGLLNESVPGNSTMFAVHFSRFAVRLYRTLVQIAYGEQPTEKELPAPTETSLKVLDHLLKCLVEDFRSLPAQLRTASTSIVTDSEDVGYALLSQTTALQLAFLAFRVRFSVNGTVFSLCNIASDAGVYAALVKIR